MIETNIHAITEFSDDPYGYVMWAYPWGSGPLKGVYGPRNWQKEELINLGKWLKETKNQRHRVYRLAVASGHGIGKGAFSSMVSDWAMSTMVNTKGDVTANTEPQLKTKTWYEMSKWHMMSKCRSAFEMEATCKKSNEPGYESSWRFDRLTWNEQNPEAFAGMHNQGRRIVRIFDESSTIADCIWDTSEGGFTDENTEIIFMALGNPTRSSGRFRECFGRFKHRWRTRNVDARDVEGTNKELFAQWIEDYGLDSDWVKVKVRGMFPSASSTQFIPSEWVERAMARRCGGFSANEPLVAGFDVARGGEDNCVLSWRRGGDAKSIEPLVIPGSESHDSMHVVSVITEELSNPKKRPEVLFVDATGVGGPVADRLKQLGFNVIDINFGSKSPSPSQANMSAYMWQKGKLWFQRQDCALPYNQAYLNDAAREYTHDSQMRLTLEKKESMKKRGLASSDFFDSLFLTFAAPVELAANTFASTKSTYLYDPYSDERMDNLILH